MSIEPRRNMWRMIAVVIIVVMGIFSIYENQNSKWIEIIKNGSEQEAVRAINERSFFIDINAKDKYGNTALMFAAESGKVEAVNALINAGAYINARSISGITVLMYATKAEIVNALLNAGADVNAKDYYGRTALMFVRNAETVNALLNAEADVNAQDNRGNTALMDAAWYASYETVNALINAGANINAQAYNGKTALIYAANLGFAETVNILLNEGADVNAQDNDGKRAVDYARGNWKLNGTDALKRLEQLSK